MKSVDRDQIPPSLSLRFLDGGDCPMSLWSAFVSNALRGKHLRSIGRRVEVTISVFVLCLLDYTYLCWLVLERYAIPTF